MDHLAQNCNSAEIVKCLVADGAVVQISYHQTADSNGADDADHTKQNSNVSNQSANVVSLKMNKLSNQKICFITKYAQNAPVLM